MSQVKFYKGMSNSNAANGLKNGGGNADNGGILFSENVHTTVEQAPQNYTGKTTEYSGRIYTKDSSKGVLEYYKEDLEFNNPQRTIIENDGVFEDTTTYTTTKAWGNIPAGTNLEGKRIIDFLKELMFATYAPKWTNPNITISYTGSDPDEYVIVGGSTSSTKKASIASSSPASAKAYKTGSGSGTADYSAFGGDWSQIQIKEGSNDAKYITSANQIDSEGVSHTFTQTTIKSETFDFYKFTNVTFSAGTGMSGNQFVTEYNVVRDSAGNKTKKTSTYANTEIANASNNDNIGYENASGQSNNEYRIKPLSSGSSLTKYITGDTCSKTVYFYAPIYVPNNVVNIEDTTLVNGKPTTPSSLSAEGTIADLSINSGSVVNGKNITTAAKCYTLEKTTGSEQWIKFTFPQVNYGTNDFKILVPDGVSIQNTGGEQNSGLYGLNAAGDAFGNLGGPTMKFVKQSGSVSLHGVTYYYWKLQDSGTTQASSIMAIKLYKG